MSYSKSIDEKKRLSWTGTQHGGRVKPQREPEHVRRITAWTKGWLPLEP